MALGIHATLRQVGQFLTTIRFDSGFTGPDGTKWMVTIRSHKDPGFEAACKEQGLHPKRKKDRDAEAKKRRNDLQDMAIDGHVAAAKDALASLLDSLTGANQEGEWDGRYDAYSDADLARLAPFVADHLVLAVETMRGDKVIETATGDEVLALFASTAILPPTFTGKEIVRFAGMPEGEAWTKAVLLVAVQDHRFWEALAPLGESSESSGGSSDTTSEKSLSPSD